MIPGRMNSRDLKRMMQQMGIKSTEMTDVKRIVMEAGSKSYVIENPQVVMIEAQGQKSFQIVGDMKEIKGPVKQPSEIGEKKEEFPEDDVRLVMEQSGGTREEALKALKEAEGEPAEAIMRILQKKK
ncbi:nascent polypeptide-associated complex protein [Caldiplasma sukawensis]